MIGLDTNVLVRYVMQDDVLFKSFTPREALTFAARLKLSHMSVED
jgi:predicted nucleic-acid-binding protein